MDEPASTPVPVPAEGFDVIGDVHGHAAKLEALLDAMGYIETPAGWRHRTRRAVFVGDLVDRGPRQLDCVRIARDMVATGAALAVAGNHEFNAVAFATPDPARPGAHLREHSDKNVDQHRGFLDQVGWGSAHHDELVAWFMTLPLWLDLDGLRVVHACWDRPSMDVLAPLVSDACTLTPELVVAASRRESPAWQAVEHVLKGPEIPLAPPYLDKGGHVRHRARFRWWDDGADRLDVAAVMPERTTTVDGAPYPPLPATPVTPPVPPYTEPVPVIYGHYWETGTPRASGPYTACVDYSAGKGGPLVAYRWSGEPVLADDRFVAVDTTPAR